MIHKGPYGREPVIAKTAFVHPSAVIIGNVKIGENVFVGPNASLRADEAQSCISIGDNSNIQDNVVMHCLENSSVEVGEDCTLGHNVVLHAPCRTGAKCSVGFGSILFNCTVGSKVVIKHNCSIENIEIGSNDLVDSGMMIAGEKDVYKIRELDVKNREFAEDVLRCCLNLAKRYKKIEDDIYGKYE
ncbi:carnitine operon protein CaiE [Sedimentisphaera cyanobacteriorum]|uniref:Carnitine operon protein CaiE n=1 Tax=Sedimentisphaera cyanobacteriorum TaxID=1940790 RepID=A0A1Q2HRR1_9BACT|nr:DapH/DapD/GlmU-related protein [Sedimentisphaera cyanobacteriorum]AQQ10137.1 carnitine operon protein CaiE [Sedimentisphaera cyanobacteriorum]